MVNKRLQFWANWLLFASGVNFIVGLALVWSPSIIKDTVYRLYTDFYYGRGGAFEALSSTDITLQTFFWGFVGSIIIGWMLAFFMIIHIPFRRGEKWAWTTILVASVVWFTLDSLVSVANGMAINLIANVNMIVLFSIPLAATYRTFFRD